MAEDRMLNDEILLGLIKANSGGGGGGTTNYNDLSNKPQIAGTELQGNKSLADLGIASASALANKVDKVEGKGLSTNDFTDAYKTAIGDNTNAINGIKDGTTIYSFSDVETVLATKQNATDNNLDTDAKTIVGAINEHEGDIDSLKSGLTNLDNEVNGDATTYPYADVITISDAVPANLSDCKVKIEPVQDLHGYDKPWVGGAGKNKLPLVLADIKAANTSGTWNGNAYTLNDVTFTVDTDSDGNVTSIVANGTASANADLLLNDYSAYLAASYNLRGCPASGSEHTYCLIAGTSSTRLATDTGLSSGFTLAEETSLRSAIRIFSGYTATNLTFYPMISLSTETDATFAPYTNICPISGHTKAVVTRDGKNLCSELESGTLDEHGMNTNRNSRVRTKYYIRVVEGQQYAVSALPAVSGKVVNIAFNGYAKNDYATYRVYDSGWLTSGSYITIPSGVKYVRCVFRYTTDENITPSSFEEVQLELGQTATPYEPYKGQQYTLVFKDSQGNPVTCYGGLADYKNGTVRFDRAKRVFDGTENWATAGASDPTAWFYVGNSGGVVQTNNVICNEFTAGTGVNQVWINFSQIHVHPSTDIVPSGNTSEGLAEFKTWLGNNNMEIVYPLATPLTVQLTPQQIQLLQGQNTLYASTGDISVSVNGVSGAIGAVQEQVNDLQGQIDEIELPSNPSADGSNLLRATTVSGETTKSWVSESLFLKTVGGKLVDCNTETSNGIIRVLANSTNMPSGAGDGVLIVFRPATDNVCVQMFIESGGKISERINWYGTWSAWKTMAS